MVEGTPQYGGQTYSTTHASQQWAIRDVPTPRQLVAQLDQWVIGQAGAKQVSAPRARRAALVDADGGWATARALRALAAYSGALASARVLLLLHAPRLWLPRGCLAG